MKDDVIECAGAGSAQNKICDAVQKMKLKSGDEGDGGVGGEVGTAHNYLQDHCGYQRPASSVEEPAVNCEVNN